MKPDIVAPGYIIMVPNANAGTGESDTREVLGTSYAAPVIAGAAAQVRQYFEEGWFPCGSKGCGTIVKPSGSLVKAVLMNSGQDLIGGQDVQTTNNVRSDGSFSDRAVVHLLYEMKIKVHKVLMIDYFCPIFFFFAS